MPRGDWVQTASGKAVYPLEPDPSSITIEDIGHSLSLQCRFMGHTRVFYSIASHCCWVSHLVDIRGPQAALWGLLHDASEAYLVDLPRPLKKLPEFVQYREIEANLMRVICEKFGLDPVEPESVRQADLIALATEARDLMAAPPKAWNPMPPPWPFAIVPVPPEEAERQFLQRFLELKGG